MKKKIYSVDAFRMIAAFCVVCVHFSFLGTVGRIFWINCYFSVPFFYIVSGYFLDLESNSALEKLKKRIGYIGKLFLFTTLIYFAINVAYFVVYNGEGIKWLSDRLTGKRVFDFIVLNVWPLDVGGAVWFLQAMFYAYIVIYFLYKLKVIKFELPIIILLLIVNAIIGEFSTAIGIGTIMANFFTRAVPYMLLGHFIRRKIGKMKKISNVRFGMIAVLSFLLCIGEYYGLDYMGWLDYTGHYQGNTLLAVVLVIFLVQRPNLFENSIISKMGAKYSLLIYLIHQPLGQFVSPHLENMPVVKYFVPVIIFVASAVMAIIFKEVTNYIKVRLNHEMKQ